MAVFNDRGEELLDDRPMSAAVGFKRPPSLADLVKSLIRNEQVQRDFETHGIETFDDADNFNTGEDMDMTSPWEENFDPLYPHIGARLDEVRSGIVQDVTPKQIAEKIAELKAELSNLRASGESQVEEPAVGTSRVRASVSKGRKTPSRVMSDDLVDDDK